MPLHQANVVRLAGTAPSCAKSAKGSGFAYAPDRVLTTAHMVAGTEGPITVTTSDGRRHEGDVVIFDPRRDVAVLRVPGLSAEFLDFDTIETGDRATFAAYSKDGEAHRAVGRGRPAPARFRQRHLQRAHGEARGRSSSRPPSTRACRARRCSGPGEEVVGMLFAANLGEPGTSYVLTTRRSPAPRRTV